MMMVPNPGFNAGLGKKSDVERFGWALAGARRRVTERRLNPMQAIAEGRELANEIAEKVSKRNISTNDAEVFLVFVEKDDIGKLAGLKFFTSPNPQADSEDLKDMRKHFHHIPVGYVVCVLDRKKRSFMAHARPLLLQDPALRLLEKLVDEVAEMKGWRLS